jgi:hypothetical protein
MRNRSSSEFLRGWPWLIVVCEWHHSIIPPEQRSRVGIVCVAGSPGICHAKYTEWQNMPSFVVLTVQRDAVPQSRCCRFIAPPDNISGALCVKACVIASPRDKTQCVPACRKLLACRTEVSSRILAEASLQALKQLGNCFNSSIQALLWAVNHTKTYHHDGM